MILRFLRLGRGSMPRRLRRDRRAGLGACGGGGSGGGDGRRRRLGNDRRRRAAARQLGRHDSGSSSGGQDATTGGDSSWRGHRRRRQRRTGRSTRPSGSTGSRTRRLQRGLDCPDDDGDGWTVCAGDCNDHDSQSTRARSTRTTPPIRSAPTASTTTATGRSTTSSRARRGLDGGARPRPRRLRPRRRTSATTRSARRLRATLWYGPNARTPSASRGTWARPAVQPAPGLVHGVPLDRDGRRRHRHVDLHDRAPGTDLQHHVHATRCR